MTYEEYKSGVKEMLLEEGEIHGTDTYVERYSRIALLEALRYFPTFKPDQVITKGFESVIPDGYACYCHLPQGANIREVRVVPSELIPDDEAEDLGPEDRLGPLEYVPWEQRDRLIQGLVRNCDLFYSVSPDRAQLIVHPKIDEYKVLHITVEALTRKFKDDDIVNVPDEVSDWFITACANYVRAQIAKDIDRNAGMFSANFGEFKRELRAIYQEIPR